MTKTASPTTHTHDEDNEDIGTMKKEVKKCFDDVDDDDRNDLILTFSS